MSYGFIKVAAAIPSLRVADCAYNIDRMLPLIAEAEKNNAEIILFPELGITSYSCGDLFRQPTIIKGAEKALSALLEATKECTTIIIAGMPIAYNSTLLDCAVVLWQGEIIGIVAKKYISNHQGCTEKRWFTSSKALPENAKVTLCDQVVSIYKNQLMLYVASKIIAEKSTDIMYETTAEDAKKMGVKKTNDFFRAMCA
jgi:NAD+ synthase (glutamine-hydrolysing)